MKGLFETKDMNAIANECFMLNQCQPVFNITNRISMYGKKIRDDFNVHYNSAQPWKLLYPHCFPFWFEKKFMQIPKSKNY